MTLRMLLSGLALLLLVTLCAGPVMACPASYVKDMAATALNSNLAGKFDAIADQYLTAKGVSPTSSEGAFIKPYVIGTTWVDHGWNIHRIDNKSVAQCVQDCLGCNHHNQHFGDGRNLYQQSLPPSRSVAHGG